VVADYKRAKQTTIWQRSDDMKTEKLEQSYKDQLIKAGVDNDRASQAAKILSRDELQLISEIWPEWAEVFSQAEGERLASIEMAIAG
jgi:hypothetical protein